MGFKEQLAIIADATEKRLLEIYNEKAEHGSSKYLVDAVKYSLLNGGKRVRAYLTIEFCELCGMERKNALDYACALEMIHAFSLIHDDLPAMDNDDMRRGKPSNHKAFGEATAILAGDSLALDAFSVCASNTFCSPAQNIEAIKLISERSGSIGMCAGQQLDLDGEERKLAEFEILNIMMHKTGDLFSAACILGCIAANIDDKIKKESASLFGYSIGEAFQITDDLLDITSTPEELGKSIGKDIEQEKSTLVSIIGFDEAKKKAEEAIYHAKKCLDVFSDSEAKNRLREFCEYILIRKK